MNSRPSTPATSHELQFKAGELVRVFAPTLLGVAAIVLLLHFLSLAGWLPVAAPVESPDEVLMRRRYDMSRAPSDANVIIIGDSTSGIDVQAALLTRLLPDGNEVLNQGMFMGIGMDIYGDAAGEFIKHHPGQVKLVVLLVTPQELQNANMSPPHQRLWHNLLAGRSIGSEATPMQEWLALDIAKDRIAGHLVPMTLYGNASLFYGHAYHLRGYLPKHNGSMVEYGSYNPLNKSRDSHYVITDAVKLEAAELRARIPAGPKLAVGITPLPDSQIAASFKDRRDQLLREFSQSVHADYLLTNLPVRLPNGYFASVYHLNPSGAEHFTRVLAGELSRLPILSSNSTNHVSGN
ncbi:hypothetical protein GC207_08925 [bacterium]|nr:hypothetical protein [bacterium]